MKTLFIKGVSLEYRVITYALLSVCIMFADNHFDYLDRLRYSMAYASQPVYWVAHIPARLSFWLGDVFVSRSNLIEENSDLREQLLIAQRQLHQPCRFEFEFVGVLSAQDRQPDRNRVGVDGCWPQHAGEGERKFCLRVAIAGETRNFLCRRL